MTNWKRSSRERLDGVAALAAVGSQRATSRRAPPAAAGARAPYSYRADATVPSFADDLPILVFDGECALCSGTVRFVLERDRRRRIRFVVAQTPLGAALYRHYGLRSGDYDTNILLENGEALTKSDSSIRIFELVGPPWSWLGAARVIPRSLRDRLYELIAKNRLRWFGARQTCYAPDLAERERFLS